MLINIIIDVVLFIVFIGCTLLLLFRKYLRSEYESIFYTDEVLKVEEVNGITSYLFEGPAETQQYINEYILCKRKRKKYFICEYGKEVKSIQYYILAYNANRKLINLTFENFSTIPNIKPTIMFGAITKAVTIGSANRNDNNIAASKTVIEYDNLFLAIYILIGSGVK